MRVLVNGLSVRNLSGQHVLLGHLRQVAEWTAGKHTFLLLHDPCQAEWTGQLPSNVQSVCMSHPLSRWSRRCLWELSILPRLLKEWNVDLAFTPSGTVLPRCHVPQVSLAQNPWCMVRQIHKGLGQKQKALVQRFAYRHAMRNAALMVYNSRHMRDLYRHNAGGAVERAGQIVYQAIDHSVHLAAAAVNTSAAKQPGLILCVSVMAPWKGTDVLVEALAVLHRRGSRARLRLVGPWSDKAYEMLVREKVAKLGLVPFVTITGGVSRVELYRHYSEAWVYCLMSQCESFGIPAVEAQIFGTPVVGSSTCATPEVCGDGGVYGSPRDVAHTADMLGAMLDDKNRWETFSERARENAARYRWDLCSRPLLDMFAISMRN